MRIDDVWKAYGPTQALAGVSLEVTPGEVHALVGGNGSGKSTLMKILAGVESADRGSIEVGSNVMELPSFSPADADRLRMRFVHQQPTVFAGLSVAENLMIGTRFPTRAGTIKWAAARERARKLLGMLDVDIDPRRKLSDLSTAEQALVEIARGLEDALNDGESLLVLDEPTTALPPAEVERLLAAVRRYRDHGGSVLFISHRLDEVLDISDRVTALRNGHLIATVTSEGLTTKELTRLIVGSDVDPGEPIRVERGAGTPVIEAIGVSGGRVVNASLAVMPGEVVGLVGLAGSGRSTLLRLLAGAQDHSGQILLNGDEIKLTSPRDGITAGIGFVPPDRTREAVFLSHTISENISLPHLRSYLRAGLLRLGRIRSDARRDILRTGVKTENEQTLIANLSGGNQQKVVMARWLRAGLRVLLLDEPSQGVDVGARVELWNLIRAAAADGTAVIVSSSDIDELLHLCNRCITIKDGRLAEEYDTATLTRSQLNALAHSA
jgi:ribose transport system ATP-binding protein